MQHLLDEFVVSSTGGHEASSVEHILGVQHAASLLRRACIARLGAFHAWSRQRFLQVLVKCPRVDLCLFLVALTDARAGRARSDLDYLLACR